MKELTPYWHTPSHQPFEGSEVTFHLRPINMPTYWAIQSSMRGNGVGYDGMSAAFEYSVLDWRGIPDRPFSAAAKRAALMVFNKNFAVWLAQITGELYTSALLTEDEKKTS